MSGSPDSSTGVFPVGGVQLDDEALECWELAAWIGVLSSDDHLRSFTSVLIALLHAPNGWSRWLLRYALAVGIGLDRIYETRQFRPHLLAEIKERRMRNEIPSGKPPWTSSATNLANGAVQLRGTSGNDPIGIRHLIGAYFYHLPTAHRDQMADWKFDRQRDGSAFLRQVRTRHPSDLDEWVALHTSVLGSPPDLEGADPLTPARVSGFAADSPEGDDQLDIEDDVYALSALICSRRVSPPLSVGLFGDWGSGKSFFIRQLQKGVSWISTQARDSGQMQKDLPFYKHVVQIEFNAWNYSGGNLWAALVQHILENLRLSDRESDDLVATRRAHLQGKMLLERSSNKCGTTPPRSRRTLRRRWKRPREH